MNEEELVQNMCITYRHDFGLLSKTEQRPIITMMTQLVTHDVRRYIASQICKNCKYLGGGIDLGTGARTAYYCGAYKPGVFANEIGNVTKDFGCKKFKNKLNKQEGMLNLLFNPLLVNFSTDLDRSARNKKIINE